MFSLEKGILLCMQLLLMVILMCHDCAEFHPSSDYRNILVSVGDFVTLYCNLSEANAKQVIWKKDTSSLFAYTVTEGKAVKYFTSHRMSINPSKLTISNTQPDDIGLYCCEVTNQRGSRTIMWNLTMFEKQTAPTPTPPWSYLYIFPPVIGLILCGIPCLAVSMYRKLRTRTPNQEPVRSESQNDNDVAVYWECEGEAVPTHHHGCSNHRPQRKHKQRIQYIERLNSLYSQN
ncbi:hypothetical protein LDENG_00005570 [Lucifuga dentata]|nr:hypothetical protein LDENG_00005570 [Lucifuga dentata]